ncbi:MAG: DUF4375 domain-containing protein [Verrucomicrobia bacterium]|nr:DUF4375 domain-containing protein [Verrucomicrobiota bacterium]
MSTDPTETDEFYWSCIEEALDEVDIYTTGESLSEGLSQFPEWVGDLLCVHWLLSEVQNGGLMQFFLNNTGVLAPEAEAALRQMNLPEAAEALNRALAILGFPYPRDKVDRYQILRARAGLKFEDMETQLWRAKLFQSMEDQLDATGGSMLRNLYVRMNEYARQHDEAHA